MNNIGYYHFGNGYSVCDRSREKNGDYVRIAHINHDRTIDWYEDVDEKTKKAVEQHARWDDSAVSVSQPDQKIFSTRPQKIELKYVGIDDWNRPVFKDGNGNYFGNVDILFSWGASYEEVREKITEEHICYFGRSMDDDPMGTPIKAERIKLVKEFTKR